MSLKKKKSRAKQATVETQNAPTVVLFHEANLDKLNLQYGVGSECLLPGGRRIQVFSIKDDDNHLSVRIFRPDNDGNTSLLLFGISIDAAFALVGVLNAALDRRERTRRTADSVPSGG